MTDQHVSELAIDRLIAGELSRATAAALRDHTETCARCSRRYGDALGARQLFERTRRPLRVGGSRLLPLAATAVTTLAAAIALIVLWPRAPGPERAGVRTKGGAIAGWFVAHDGAVRRGAPREVTTPGDRIELFTTTSSPVWFAAVGVDAAGVRTVYAETRLIAPGREQLVPGAIALDQTLGAEVVTAVFCVAPFDAAGIDLHVPPSGCTTDRLVLIKVPR